ncbi:MAG TPA: response regulator transcription factor [Vicinamibacterales bacterium]
MRVLLADDNEAMLDRAAEVLSPDFQVVGSVNSGPAAMQAAVSLRPDVIVLDISMPGMSGLEVASRLRKAGSKAAVVFLTGHRSEAFVEAAMAAGAIGYVVKTRLGSDLTLAVRDARAGRPFVSRLS